MSGAAEVVRFYVLCNKLKDVVRTGWKIWNVRRERLESVAEHVYGVQMLVIAMWSEYKYDIDLEKVILMLTVHELEEVGIGDLNPFEMSKAEKMRIGHKAVEGILGGLAAKEEIRELISEFDDCRTEEASFAHFCDKLEADIQCKMYDEEGCIDMGAQEGNVMLKADGVREIAKGEKSASGVWLEYNRRKNGYDENFAEVSDYVRDHEIIKTP